MDECDRLHICQRSSPLCDCGKAQIDIDGQKEAVLNPYSADDIFGVGIYGKGVRRARREHRVKVTVSGEHEDPRGTRTLVCVDGVRIGP